MKIVIDHDRCAGHGRCYVLSPELFSHDDEGGYGQVVGDGVVTSDTQAAAVRGVAGCPEGSIHLVAD